MLYRIIHQVVAIPVQPYLIPRGVSQPPPPEVIVKDTNLHTQDSSATNNRSSHQPSDYGMNYPKRLSQHQQQMPSRPVYQQHSIRCIQMFLIVQFWILFWMLFPGGHAASIKARGNMQRKMSFFPSTIRLWNELPQEAVSASTVDAVYQQHSIICTCIQMFLIVHTQF